jgi:hypothetical protein
MSSFLHVSIFYQKIHNIQMADVTTKKHNTNLPEYIFDHFHIHDQVICINKKK